MKYRIQALGPLIAFLLALAVGSIFCLLYGQSPFQVYRAMLLGTWGDFYSLGQVLYKATLLAFTGLSVALAFRAGLFNIGAEGQVLIGAFCTAWIGTMLPAGTPWVIAIPICLLSGALGGAFWGIIPGVLRAFRGAHEVITTIMLNFIAILFLNYLLTEQGFAVSESVHTESVVEGARIARFSDFLDVFSGSAANLSIFLAILVACLVWILLFRTRLGFSIRAFGLSPEAAKTSGISASFTIVVSMALAGAIAGLGGSNFVLGYKGYFEEGFSSGVGFMGIAVALFAKNSPGWILFASLLFGTLSQGGLAINAQIPKDLIDILQGVVIIAVVAANQEVRRLAKETIRPIGNSTANIAKGDT